MVLNTCDLGMSQTESELNCLHYVAYNGMRWFPHVGLKRGAKQAPVQLSKTSLFPQLSCRLRSSGLNVTVGGKGNLCAIETSNEG